MSINCCKGCVPPKRNPWCHGCCPEYLKEKAQHDEKKAEEDRRKRIEHGLNSQCVEGIYRANKARRQKG